MNPVEQIIELYNSDEFWWRGDKWEVPSLRSYIWQMINRGNLFWAVDGEKLVGVCETWRVSFETLGKMVCKVNDPIESIDTTDGNIAFVCNVWIHKDYRRGKVYKEMRREWYKRFHVCEYYVGHAQRKSVGMYKAFKVSELKSNLFRQGE
jgi:ribosomal protein S18 acetylase RimI-like enzyme